MINSTSLYTAFDGHRRIASGAMQEVALTIKRAVENGIAAPVLIYSDDTGLAIDIDIRGSEGEVMARFEQRGPYASANEDRPADGETRGRGRPKLGVVAREVTLLPRHWEWLNGQRGGASVALRKLVEEARRTRSSTDRRRQRQEAAYHFMASIAGDLPGFEEAIRSLYAEDRPRFEHLVTGWPQDVRSHAIKLAFGSDGDPSTPPLPAGTEKHR